MSGTNGIKLLALLLALSPFFLSSCGRKTAPPPPPPKQQEAKSAPAEPKIEKAKVEDKEEGSLVAKISVKDAKGSADPKIEDDASNVVVDDDATSVASRLAKESARFKFQLVFKPSENSLASRIPAIDGLRWTPAWRFKGVGGPWLEGFAVSSDGSLLAVVETTGAADGPFGARIVVWSVAEWKTLKVVEIDRHVKRFVFIPDSCELLAFCAKQADLKQPNALVKIDLSSGGSVPASEPLMDGVASLVCVNPSLAFFTLETAKEIRLCHVQDMKMGKKIYATANRGGALLPMENGGVLLCAGSLGLELFKISGNGLLGGDSIRRLALPDGLSSPASLLELPGTDGNFALAPSLEANVDEDAFLMKGGNASLLAKNASGLLSYDAKNKILFVGAKAKRLIKSIQIPSMEELRELQTDTATPKTSGTPVQCAFLTVTEALCVLDSTGNLYLLKKPLKEKSWKKFLVFAPKR